MLLHRGQPGSSPAAAPTHGAIALHGAGILEVERLISPANPAALAAVRALAEREALRHLARIARVLGEAGVDADVDALLAAEWRDGLTLALSDVPRDTLSVTGELMRWQVLCGGGRAYRLAERVAGHCTLDAATIGQAAVSVVRDPALWRDWGSRAEVLGHHLKDLWLMVVALGRPGERRAR